MAKSDAIWGIDVGNAALKAVRCRAHGDGKRLVADAFDFIEYPKILTQPDADPVALVNDAIELFLSRNDLKNDQVAVSVSGQNGLARFIKLPPVESKKIPDIVKFEARQQIPFALEDVVWDFQQMPGGSEEDGYALETEVGLFAMKRDQVFRALRPFTHAGIEVDLVQLTPISLFNYILFDQMQDLPPPDQFDPENPPDSVVVMSMGTDTTDLVVTNGYRVWQRSIPLGGNHFTKAITKEIKVTFTKAEHLKRNALKTDEAKAIFQAMRPVFNDLVSEVQRSISFFMSLNKTAKIGRIVALGGTMKLKGLQKYLQQNLGIEVQEVESYRALTGPAVVNAPAFNDNVMSFGVCYGLCVQGVGHGVLSTNLLPDEILKDRLVREKKPWVLAAVASLMVGFGVGFAGHWRAWNSAREEAYKSAFDAEKQLKSTSDSYQSEFKAAQDQLDAINKTGEAIAGIADQRVLWAELSRAISECLPKDPPGQKPEKISERNEVHITQVDCEMFTDVSTWFTDVKDRYEEFAPKPPAATAPVAPAAAETAEADAAAGDAAATADAGAEGDAAAATDSAVAGPTGEGWIIQLTGHHYHNEDPTNQRGVFVARTLLRNLEEKTIRLPVMGRDGKVVEEQFTMKELGISYPTLVWYSRIVEDTLQDPTATTATTGRGAAAGASGQFTVKKCNFLVQFVWTETPVTERLRRRAEQKKAKELPSALAANPNLEQGNTP